MDIPAKYIRIFQEVAQAGNMSRAAERLGVTQPAVSMAIRDLEESLGVPLVIRSKRGVELTKAGSRFSTQSRKLIQEWEGLRAGLLRDEQELQGSYSIGVHPAVAVSTLPRFASKVLEGNDQLDLQFIHDLSRKISEGVISYKIDFGIVVNPPRHLDLTIVKLYKDEVTFWTKKRRTSTQKFLANAPIVICDTELKQTEQLLAKATRSKFFQNPRVINSSDLLVISELVASGVGCGAIPNTVAKRWDSKNLVPIKGSPSVQDEICLIYRKDAQTSNAAKYIKECIVSTLKS